jgi:hypothetical protein
MGYDWGENLTMDRLCWEYLHWKPWLLAPLKTDAQQTVKSRMYPNPDRYGQQTMDSKLVDILEYIGIYWNIVSIGLGVCRTYVAVLGLSEESVR